MVYSNGKYVRSATVERQPQVFSRSGYLTGESIKIKHLFDSTKGEMVMRFRDFWAISVWTASNRRYFIAFQFNKSDELVNVAIANFIGDLLIPSSSEISEIKSKINANTKLSKEIVEFIGSILIPSTSVVEFKAMTVARGNSTDRRDTM